MGPVWSIATVVKPIAGADEEFQRRVRPCYSEASSDICFQIHGNVHLDERMEVESSHRRKKFGGILVHEKGVDHPVIPFILRVVAFVYSWR